jgi:hypothetical protein
MNKSGFINGLFQCVRNQVSNVVNMANYLKRSICYLQVKNDIGVRVVFQNVQATQEEADQLADELNENWWAQNRKRFI